MSGSGPPAQQLDGQQTDGRQLGRWRNTLEIGIRFLIVYSVVTAAIETLPSMRPYARWFWWSECFVVLVFTAEYLVRWWYSSNWRKYPFTPMAIIDLLAIVPFYVNATIDFRPLRTLRLLRIFRLLKLARYSRSLQMMGEAMRRVGPELLVFGFVAAIIVLISAMGLYYAEHQAQPEVYKSIPDSIWWAIVTLTTVGYGDVYPTTTVGRVIASIVMLTGIGFIAVPTSLISSAMTELAMEARAEKAAEKQAAEQAAEKQAADDAGGEAGGGEAGAHGTA